MGKTGHREKWIGGKLHLLCLECLDYKLEEEFYFSSYITFKGNKSRRSECIKCHNLSDKERRIKNHYG